MLAGAFQNQAHWAVWAATGVILSATYMLWAYQRVFYGEITHAENREIPDLNRREQWVLVAMCAFMIWLGVHANFFLRRYEMSCEYILRHASPAVSTQAAQPNPSPQTLR